MAEDEQWDDYSQAWSRVTSVHGATAAMRAGAVAAIRTAIARGNERVAFRGTYGRCRALQRYLDTQRGLLTVLGPSSDAAMPPPPPGRPAAVQQPEQQQWKAMNDDMAIFLEDQRARLDWRLMVWWEESPPPPAAAAAHTTVSRLFALDREDDDEVDGSDEALATSVANACVREMP